MKRELKDDYIFDFPETEENKEIFESKIDWKKEEKRLNEEEKRQENRDIL